MLTLPILGSTPINIDESVDSSENGAENEDQNGPEIGARYKVGVVPTYLILDAEGNEIGRATGGAPPNQFISMISRTLGESTSTFDAMQARYDEGDRSQEFIQQYLMDVIVELALRDVDNQDIASMQAAFEESAKYKTIADEFFASRPYSELINKTDARLVMYFHERSSRGDEIVEFVIEHYNEFLAVSSESAMAQLVLNATLGAVADAARAGDEKFTDYIDALETEPLNRAVAHERARYPDSSLLPERLKYSWEADYLIAREDWDGIAELYKGRFEKWGDKATAGNYQWAADRLLRSDNPTHRKTALGYARRAYEMNEMDYWVVSVYISALAKHEMFDEAREIAREYRSGLTDSAVDQENLEIFNRLTRRSWKKAQTTPKNHRNSWYHRRPSRLFRKGTIELFGGKELSRIVANEANLTILWIVQEHLNQKNEHSLEFM